MASSTQSEHMPSTPQSAPSAGDEVVPVDSRSKSIEVAEPEYLGVHREPSREEGTTASTEEAAAQAAAEAEAAAATATATATAAAAAAAAAAE